MPRVSCREAEASTVNLVSALEAMEAGRNPIGISFDASAPPVEFEAGNYIREG